MTNSNGLRLIFAGKFNSGRICEIHHSMTRKPYDDEPALTKRARLVEASTDLPPPPPYMTPYEMRRAQAALRSAANSLRALIEKAQATLAMMDRVLK